MEDIKKAIEEEAKKEAWNHGEATVGDPYVKYQADCGFRAGASFATDFILSKWEESERWRKVEEELPEKGVEVIVTRTDGIRMLAWLDEDSEPFFNVSGNEEYFIDDIHSWKPIH